MKKIIYSIAFAALLISCGTPSKTADTATKTQVANTVVDPTTYATSITSEDLKELLYTYASDEFQGRGTGEPGIEIATNYLKNKYVSMGIPAAKGGDNYFQEVPLLKQSFPTATMNVNGSTFNNFENLIALSGNESILNAKEIVYVGYGIDSDTYSDYKNIDVKGKIVLAKAGEPKTADGNYVTTGKSESTKWTTGRQAITSKGKAAEDHGAKAFIYVDEAQFANYSRFISNASRHGARFSLKSNTEPLAMYIANIDLGKALYSDIETKDAPISVSTELTINTKNSSEEITQENVAAFIKGSEKPDEIIVISAHLDHEGVKDGEIYNGADDDGSGTVAVLEIAEAFKKAVDAGHAPKRSILFLHVTAEEKGLLGSQYYTDIEPLFPLENSVANLNIDMIGRIDPKRQGNRNYVYLIGSDKLSTELHELSEAVNKKYTNITLDYTFNDDNDPNRFYYRSDHYNFAKNNIPVIFYFNGTHDDYHRPSDTPDKIEYDLLENRTRLVFYTAWELANREQRITVDKSFK
ncbi:MAG TPA: M28 family peptidase [Aquaticitalea sp.]|nr:M28 family peptidase [Aquaticitalea sp.]